MLGRRQLAILEVLAQPGLQDLAGGGVRDRLDELHGVGQPPFGDLGAEEVDQLLPGHAGFGLAMHDQQWPILQEAEHR